MRAANDPTLPRLLHPAAWWVWALALAVGVSRTENPLLALLTIAVTAVVVRQRQAPAAGRVFRLFLGLGAFAIALRIAAVVIFGSPVGGEHVLFTMPGLPLPDWAGHLRLGQDVTLEGIVVTVAAGLGLAAVLACLGAANALASPRRLLRYVPATLYEVGTAVVVGLTWAPQLARDAARVRAAQRLRGRSGRSLRDIGALFTPVLAGALDRSLDLAASMESRGYGRTLRRDGSRMSLASGLAMTATVGVVVSLYGVLTGSDGWLATPLFLAALALAAVSLLVGARRDARSAFRRDPWALPEWLVVACGVLPAAVLIWGARAGWPGMAAGSDALALPEVPPLAVAALLWGAAPAFLAPPLPADPATVQHMDHHPELEAAA